MKKLLIFLLSLLFLMLLTLLFIFMKEDQSLTDSSEKGNDVQTESGTENDSDKEGEQDSSGQTEEEKLDAKVQDLIAGMSLEERLRRCFLLLLKILPEWMWLRRLARRPGRLLPNILLAD